QQVDWKGRNYASDSEESRYDFFRLLLLETCKEPRIYREDSKYKPSQATDTCLHSNCHPKYAGQDMGKARMLL
ncbi:hypothetical protein J6590_019275, partial [Homalodisca vitripennis]